MTDHVAAIGGGVCAGVAAVDLFGGGGGGGGGGGRTRGGALATVILDHAGYVGLLLEMGNIRMSTSGDGACRRESYNGEMRGCHSCGSAHYLVARYNYAFRGREVKGLLFRLVSAVVHSFGNSAQFRIQTDEEANC